MSNYPDNRSKISIDLSDIAWRLLYQWKAILIFSILTGLLVSGAKYAKDKSEYHAALLNQQTAAEESVLPAKERIDKVLQPLSDKDKDVVNLILQQQELINSQNDYLKNSIWINTNPDNQRLLIVSYYIYSSDDSNMQPLIDAYNKSIRKDIYLKAIGNIIDNDAQLVYIDELINTYGGVVSDSEVSSTVYTIEITLTDGTDIDALANAIGDIMKSISSELTATFGKHSVKEFYCEEVHNVNSKVSDKLANITYTINNLTTSINTAKLSLTPEQLAAVTAIENILSETSAVSDKTESAPENIGPSVPAISTRYVATGLLLGIIIYSGIYIIMLVMKNHVSSAMIAKSSTRGRLLGEIHYIKTLSGLRALFHSNFIEKLRYRNLPDVDAQIDKAVNTIETVCMHDDESFLSVFDMMSSDEEHAKIANKIFSDLGGRGIDVNIIDAVENFSESSLLSIKNALYLISSDTGISDLNRIVDLCNIYDIKQLGSVYIQ